MSEIKALHKKLTQKEIKAAELAREYLNNIEKGKDINAYVTVTDEVALKKAEEVDEKIAKGEEINVLAGIPMSLKDVFSTKDIRTTCSSKMLENYIPVFNSTIWEKLENDGAVLLGKTNMDEFAMGSTTESSYFGATLNPYNKDRVPGGSSGGAAASVAANQAVYALGSDTGGSVRQPASFCGLVGLKPTYGSLSRYGIVGYASSFDQAGILTKTAEDCALVYDNINFYDKKDSTSKRVDRVKTADYLNNSVKGMKIGVPEEYLKDIDEETLFVINKGIDKMKEMGMEIVPISLDFSDYSLAVYYILSCAEVSSNMGRFDGIRYGYRPSSYTDYDDMIIKARTETLGDETKLRIILGTYVLTSGHHDAYYKKAQQLRQMIKASYNFAFEKCDVIVTPTSPVVAPRIGEVSDSLESYKKDICTVPVNTAGIPALNINSGFTKDGLPVGISLVGNYFEEHKLLNVAHQFEMLG